MSTISIQFDEKNSSPWRIAVVMEMPLAENEAVWVWDHYFSTVLNRLSEDNESENLMGMLSDWATTFAKNMRLSFDELSKNNLLQLSREIQLLPSIDVCGEEILIEATSVEGHWPNVHMKIDESASSQHLCFSVLALAQFFLDNNPYFYRELPLHVLAMRKFYQEELPYSDEASIQQAPAFAFDTALKFQQSLSKA